MLKNEMKASLALLGAVFVPAIMQADQSMDDNQMQQQMYVPGEMIKADQLPAGYSASASYQCADGWDVFITADYIYWAWQQDSFQLGTLDPNVSVNLLGSAGNRQDVFQNPGYASGFQVGAGVNMPGMDDWNLYAEYTWYKNSNSDSVSSDTGRILRPTTGSFFAKESLTLGGLIGTISSDIEMKFDSLDVLLKRPFYFGKKLTANFAAGLKALWITQDFDTTMVGLSGPNINVAINRFSAVDLTSWGLGPKFGIETSWMLGYGLQIMADLSASMLYTRYNLNSSGYATIANTSLTSSREELDNYNTLRAVTEAFLGFGWNTGFYDNKYRVQISAGYDFDLYWNYDMLDYTTTKVRGDMYLQGLNIQVRFDF